LGKVNVQNTYLDGSTSDHDNVTLELYIPLEEQTTSKRLYALVNGNELSNAFEILDWAIRYYNADGTLRGNTHWLTMLTTNTDSYLEVIFTDPE